MKRTFYMQTDDPSLVVDVTGEVEALREVAKFAEKMRDLDANESITKEWVDAYASARVWLFRAVDRLDAIEQGDASPRDDMQKPSFEPSPCATATEPTCAEGCPECRQGAISESDLFRLRADRDRLDDLAGSQAYGLRLMDAVKRRLERERDETLRALDALRVVWQHGTCLGCEKCDRAMKQYMAYQEANHV